MQPDLQFMSSREAPAPLTKHGRTTRLGASCSRTGLPASPALSWLSGLFPILPRRMEVFSQPQLRCENQHAAIDLRPLAASSADAFWRCACDITTLAPTLANLIGG